MNPLELIHEGIRTENWDMVAQGYALLTGSMPDRSGSPAKPQEGLRETLLWYADGDTYRFDPKRAIPIMLDCGKRAKIALGNTVPAGKPSRVKEADDAFQAEVPKKKGGRKKATSAVVEVPPQKHQVTLPSSPAAPRPANRNWDPPAGNKYRDNLNEASKDRKATAWINANVTPTEKRAAVSDPEVTIECDECNRKYQCVQSLVKRKRPGASETSDDDLGSLNVCPRCLREGRSDE